MHSPRKAPGVSSSPLSSGLLARREKNSLTCPSPHKAPVELITCDLSSSAWGNGGGGVRREEREPGKLREHLSGYPSQVVLCPSSTWCLVSAFHPNPSSSLNLPSLPALPKGTIPFRPPAGPLRVPLIRGGQCSLPSLLPHCLLQIALGWGKLACEAVKWK